MSSSAPIRDDGDRKQRLTATLERVVERRLSGDDCSDAEVIAAHGDLMPELKDRLAQLRLVLGARHRASLERSTMDGRERATTRGMNAPATLTLPGYRIESEIHRGGQGVVYHGVHLATKRSVAIKVLASGAVAGPRERARFDLEAQLLAQLRHPHIVTIHDSGVVDDVAYLVMDYIEGQPLDRHCRETGINARKKLAIMQQVCDAVGFAHLRGIIHRDLKPSNVLVDAEDTPHVLDFGLAKLVERTEAAAAETALTETGQFVGSLPWSSPEQVLQTAFQIDIRTDVYSLGVMLYEVLTRRFPYEVTGPAGETIRAIANKTPPPPSRIVPQLTDEIDTVVLKALSKDPPRRYQSAGELARDIQHLLLGRPIDAKRDSAWYLLRKTVQRHKLVTALACGLVITAGLASGWIWLLYGQARDQAALARTRQSLAEREAGRATAVQEFLEDLLAGADPWLGAGDELRVADVLEEARRQLQNAPPADPAVEVDVRRAIGRSFRHVGRLQDARAQLEQAVALSTELYGPDHERTLATRYELGLLQGDAGEYDAARRTLTEVHAGLTAKLGTDHERTLATGRELADILHERGEVDAAIDLMRGTYAAYLRREGPKHEQTLDCLAYLALYLHSAGSFEEAEELMREALAGRRALHGENHPKTLIALDNLALLLRDLGRHDEAVAAAQRALTGFKAALGERHLDTLRAMNNLATCLEAAGRVEQALALHQKCLPLRMELLGPDHLDTLGSLFHLANLSAELGRAQSAEQFMLKARDGVRRTLGEDNRYFSLATFGLAEIKDALDEQDEADRLFQHALSIARVHFPPGHPRLAEMHLRYGEFLLDAGRPADAAPHLRQAYAKLAATFGDASEQATAAAERLAELRELEGSRASARQDADADP